LWYFHVHMYYNPNWFVSIFLHSTLIPFLWWFQQDFQILYPLIHCWWECKLVQPLWKTVWRLLMIQQSNA
jgi:hypothetical protein